MNQAVKPVSLPVSHRRQRWRPVGALALLVLLVLALAACGKRPHDKLALARQLLARNDRAAAMVHIKAEVQANPQSADARLLLGQVLLDGGDPVAAEVELRRALERRASEHLVLPLLARALLASGQAPRLVKEFAEVRLADAQATAGLKTLVAEAQATTGDLAGAHRSIGLALQGAPNHVAAQVMGARLTAAGGDLPGALRQLEGLLAAQAGSADAWVLKGDLLARQQAPADQVLQALRQALVAKPDHAVAHAALISHHLAHRDLAAAQLQLDAMRTALPRHPQTLLYDGQIAYLKGDLVHARGVFQTLLRVMPKHLALLQSAGAVELRLQATGQAEALLTRALQIDPASPATRRLLARCFLSSGQAARVGPVLEPLLAGGQADAETWMMAAQARLLLGDPAGAAQWFDRAAKLQPDDPKIRTAMALSRVAKGQTDAAIVDLQQVAASDAGTSADMALIATHLGRKAYDPALKAVDALEKKLAGQALPAHLRGQVLLAKQAVPAARQAFEQALSRDPKYYPAVAALAGLDVLDRQPDAARARFEALLQLDPKNSPARLALVALAARAGARRAALSSLLDEAVMVNPTDPAPRLALIDHHLGGGDHKAALAAAQAALAHLPESTALLGRLAQAQLRAGEHLQALNTSHRIVALQPRSPVGPTVAAEAQLQAKDLPAAQRSLKKALELAPEHLPARQLAIGMALQQRQPEQALALARDVQQLRPDEALGFLLEGEIALTMHRPAEAVVALRKALGKANPARAPERLHQALRLTGKTAEADAMGAGWLQAHPDDALFHFYLGDVAMGQKDHAAAEAHYRTVLALRPEHALALNNVAWMLLAQKKPGALPLAERAAQAAPEHPAVLDTLAQAQAAENQWPKALATQQRALALRPDDPGLRLGLARLYARSGDKNKARAELDGLAALGERFAGQAEVAALRQGLGAD